MLRPGMDLRHTDVVKSVRPVSVVSGAAARKSASGAAGLSTRLSLTPAAVRRHLDNLLADNMIETRTARRPASRGRGRPAKLFAITDVGRGAFGHAYDDLATSALRFLAEVAGPAAVAEFARRQVADLERRYSPVVAAAPAQARVQALAEAL